MLDRIPRPHSRAARSRAGDKALLVALNYKDEPEGSPVHCLDTPIRDARGFARLLEEKGYLKQNIVVMTDEADHPAMVPTRENLVCWTLSYPFVPPCPTSLLLASAARQLHPKCTTG